MTFLLCEIVTVDTVCSFVDEIVFVWDLTAEEERESRRRSKQRT
jgi:hypothetical protein